MLLRSGSALLGRNVYPLGVGARLPLIGLAVLAFALETGCFGNGHIAEPRARAHALCSSQERADAGFGASLLDAKPTTARDAAAVLASIGLPINDWSNLPPSTFVAGCRYKVLDGPVTYWFVTGTGRSTLAPPSLSVTPPGTR